MKTPLSQIFQFLLYSAREKIAQKCAFTVIGGGMAFYADVVAPFRDAVWITAIVLGALAILGLLAVLFVGRNNNPLIVETTDAAHRAIGTRQGLPRRLLIPRDVTFFFLTAAALLTVTGIGQLLAASRSATQDAHSVSLFATLIPELKGLRRDVAGVREDLQRVDQKLDNVKRENSADPRKELANLGITWTVDAFFDAIRRGDRRTVDLFLAGDMKSGTPDSQGRSLPIMLAQNKDNAGEMLDLLVAGGLDINRAYEVPAPIGEQKRTLLSRAIEAGNLPLVEALIRHGARTEDPTQTFAAMGFPYDTYPLASAFYLQQLDIAEALVKAGAKPETGDYAAYREALALRQKPNVSPAAAARLDALIIRLKPAGQALERIEAERRLQVVEQKLTEVALEGFRTMRGSSDKARLDREYESLQQERTRLKAQLNIKGN